MISCILLMVAVLGKVHGTKKTGGGASTSETGQRRADVDLAEVAAEGSVRVVQADQHGHAADEEQRAAPGGEGKKRKSKGGRGTYVKIKYKLNRKLNESPV